MTRVVRAGWLAVAVVAIIAASASIAAAQSDTPELVIIDASTERNDVTVTVVAPPELLDNEVDDSSFLVTVDGVQRIPTVELIQGEELEVVLLMDTSGSMGLSLDVAKAAANQFIAQLPNGTRVSVVGFGDEVTVMAPFTDNLISAASGIETLESAGNTALYAAVIEASRQFDPRLNVSRSIVLLSDGGNTVDEASLGLAQSALLASDATLYAISISTADANPAELESLSSASGGTVVSVDNADGLTALYDDIGTILRNQYRLSFESSGSGRVPVFIQARLDFRVLSEKKIAIELPTRRVVVPTATPVVLNIAPRTVTTPEVTTTDVSSGAIVKWFAISFFSIGIAVLTYLLLFPVNQRRNVLRDYGPVVGSATRKTSGLLGGIPGLLVLGADRALAGRGLGTWISFRLEAAGQQIRTSEFVVLLSLSTFVAFGLGALISVVFALAFAMIVVLVVFAMLAVGVANRRRAFANQLNGTLQLMAGSLRTGYSLAQVFDVVARESESPTSEEFTRVVVESRLGRDLIESCRDLVTRMDSEDFDWVTNAIEVTREIGGDLAEVLDNVAGTVRVRERIRRQVRALSAEGRISAWILGLLPFPMFFWQLFVNREYTMLLFDNGLGLAIFTTSVTLLTIGVVWMRSIIQLRF